jgi:arylsulfatase A-like enzyme
VKIVKSIRDDEVMIGQMLKSAGYATACYCKWHLSCRGPEAHGYDSSDGDKGNQEAAQHLPPNPVDIFGMGARAVEFLMRSQTRFFKLDQPLETTPNLARHGCFESVPWQALYWVVSVF